MMRRTWTVVATRLRALLGARAGSAARRAARVACRFASGAAALLAACGPREPAPERPSQPTLAVGVDRAAATDGPRVVAAGQIAQPWHTGAWAPASITLTEVAAGDVIVVAGAYWGDLRAGASTAPTDDRGELRRAIDQGPVTVGRKKPPVFAQLYVELAPAPGAHTIVPPYLGGPAGDGTLYVLQLRGLAERRLIAIGHRWTRGDALPSVEVALDAPARAGDLVIALAGYDNTEPRDRPGFRPPTGWLTLGAQEDASNNVPSALGVRAVDADGDQAATWAWSDPKVNVAAAVIAALR